jgi:hypothetical protein
MVQTVADKTLTKRMGQKWQTRQLPNEWDKQWQTRELPK